MKFTDKILSLPPYISTSWKNVLSLHVENRQGFLLLVVELVNGSRVMIPGLDQPTIEKIFACHADFLEEQESSTKKPTTFAFPLAFNFPEIEGMNGMLQHNPDQANTLPLPAELLEKVSNLTKMMGENVSSLLPKAEPHCNCPHCQIMRALTGEANSSPEEEVTEEDLKFRTWDITQTADKLYTVINPLDVKEHYNVFLGEPIGCTCGQKDCEHIQAVLKS